jgi:ATP-binding cassette subfamily B protein
LLTLIFVALAKISALSAPFALKFIIDTAANSSTQDQVVIIVLSLVFAYVLALFSTTLFDELKSVVAEKTVQPIIASVGKSVFSKLIDQPHDKLIKNSFGATIKDIDRGLKSLQSLVALSIHTIFPLIVEVIAMTVFTVFYFDLYFGMLLIIGIIFHIYFTISSTNKLNISREKLNTHDSALSGKFTEAINNIETIKIFKSEKYETLRFTSIFHSYAREAINYQLTYTKVRLIQQTIICIILLALLSRAGWSLSNGLISLGDFVLINAMAMQVLIPISFVGTVWKDFTQFIIDVKIFSPFLEDSKSTLQLNKEEIKIEKISIKFSNVSFSYNGIEPNVKDISLDIPNGSLVAIVGSSGSGKSTILKLMAGLIKPDSGSIFFNDKELTPNTLEVYTRAMAMVPQNVVLFHGSISENIIYSNRQTSEEAMVAASKSAQLHSRVIQFADGYKTSVGERGLRLSGGERQLLGLTRALLKNPKILLLDEPSSALDAKTEAKLIEDSLLSASSLTRVVVTHRLNSIRKADKIYVVDTGRIIEQGTHEELLNKNGTYAKLWDSQLAINHQ